MNPITPSEIRIYTPGPLFDHAIAFINEAITCRNWHDNFADPLDIQKEYHAIMMKPWGYFTPVMDKVVEKYKELGWDCMQRECYDARGPHRCFYINKKHFQ